MHPAEEPRFSLVRSLKLGTFHIGSSLADLLTSAVWNRILVVDLGVAAWPIALLTALRYFLAPLTLWAGHQSDTRPILGSRRIAYIWLGRLLMLVSLPLLPLSTVEIAADISSARGWALALLSFVLYGVGTLSSGAPFLALVHDSAPYERRGQAVAAVQFMLVVSFAFIPALYAGFMPSYSPEAFWRLVLIGMTGAAFFWIVSVLGEEKRLSRQGAESPVAGEKARQAPPPAPSFRLAFGRIWAEGHTRRYAVFLGVSAFFAFMQDAMLEPFGGNVFGLAAGATTRFNAYWGAGVLVGMAGAFAITRNRRPEEQAGTTALGLALLALPLLLLSLAAFTADLGLVVPGLVAFGLGFGVFTVGGVSLLMAMSREEQAGSYLALWSVVQLITRGAGIASGGILRDVVLNLTGQYTVAYGALFLIEALGLFLAILLLRAVDVPGFAAQRPRQPSHTELLSAID